jgi:hypothetical protein
MDSLTGKSRSPNLRPVRAGDIWRWCRWRRCQCQRVGLGRQRIHQKPARAICRGTEKNPQTRKELAAMATTEGNAANLIEALMNRMAMTHGSIAKGLHSGFYGPINRGQLPGNGSSNARFQPVALRGHQAQEFGSVNLANIAEMLGYSDDPIPML